MENKNLSNFNFQNIIKDKSAVSVALATLILLLLSFFVVRYFNGSENIEEKLNGEGLSTVIEESTDTEGDKAVNSKENSEKEEDKNDATENKEIATDENQPAIGGADYNPEQKAWMANDLAANSLKGDTYTVQEGDTLWEIAEGFSGNPTAWTQIAQANNVSYMANGSPLIVPGQVLTIPSLN